MSRRIYIQRIPASPGISTGKAYIYIRSDWEIDLKSIGKDELHKEISDFEKAIDLSKKELTKIKSFSYEKSGKNSWILMRNLRFSVTVFYECENEN